MWLLEASVRNVIEQAQKNGVTPTLEQQIEYEARNSFADDDGNSRILTIAGNNAQIDIKGVITKSPSFFAMIFGGGNTTYSDIISALAQVDSDPAITDITLAIDSPGGSIDGLFDTLAAIQNTSKPIKAVVANLAASAAFAIASQADSIVATNRATRVGSVGVVATFDVSENEVSIASTQAPKKRPDVTTAEGVAMVREELDALHDIFVDSIAEGRGTTIEKVNTEFGQGGTLLASEALKRGMIDSIAQPALKVVNPATTTTANIGGNQLEASIMDLTQLKAQHPDVYNAAVTEGITKERDRVEAHLTMGEASGETKTAYTAIKDGSEMTSALSATYMAAGIRRSNVEARQDDDVDANAGDNATLGDDTGDAADAVASMVETQLGLGAQ